MPANPASWITPGYILGQALWAKVMPSDFLQLHAGVAADSQERWIDRETWNALKSDAEPAGRIVVAVDVVPGGRIRNDSVKDFIRALNERLRVEAVIYDERYFGDAATELSHEGFNYGGGEARHRPERRLEDPKDRPRPGHRRRRVDDYVPLLRATARTGDRADRRLGLGGRGVTFGFGAAVGTS